MDEDLVRRQCQAVLETRCRRRPRNYMNVGAIHSSDQGHRSM